jgi:hypothetical protein
MGGSNPTVSTPKSTEASLAQSSTIPNLFSAQQKYLPAQTFGNQQISNPTSILNAYMTNMPRLLQAAQSQKESAQAIPTATTTSATGGVPSFGDLLAKLIKSNANT